MRIGDWMTRDPVVITPDTLVMEANRMMNQYKIHHLPVVKKGKLVGIVTRRKVLEASPSAATSLSIHELSYLLANMKVEEIMERNVVAVAPDARVEEAVLLAYQKGIGSIPVVEGGKLVGIATATEITRAFLEIFAARDEDVLRLTLLGVYVDENTFPTIASVLREQGAVPVSLVSIPWRGAGERRVIIRCKAPKHRAVVGALKEAGFVVERMPSRRSK
jgi:acetoin utilization protein AcuB